MTYKYKAYRSKKSGRYFRPIQYEVGNTTKFVDRDDINYDTIKLYPPNSQLLNYKFHGHAKDKIEVVFFNLVKGASKSLAQDTTDINKLFCG